MSGYVVAKVEIDALMTAGVRWSEETPGGGLRYYWYRGGGRPVDAASATSIGQMLWHANWYRAEGMCKDDVRDVPDEPRYAYEPLPGDPDPLLVLWLRRHYSYQTAGEPEEWLLSEAFGFVRMLERVAIDRLPGSKDLPWGIGEQDRDVFQRHGK